MKKSAIVPLLVCAALLAGCVATRPMTEAERDYQQRAEQERRTQVINTGP
jgi:PBP1b-binding outer membrane lipoprotein LpoB